ncbi:hypothetical protein O9H85_23880 [Paenibacillus filicis]|uniref:Magnesium transporter MgtE intracellular domain-containing protein n=1 Tax=Paenibacillus gyeongsangnamensis TaxID=3388067 RepID=A0ABT4QFD1_9BACL|nr:hypothetical protein [Paenibacillus filicis]MCZ8515395.1 hypothetical protein [Paenibacillus filicis]
METPDNSLKEITNRQRLTYFVVIPVLFTTALLGVGTAIIQQGKGKSFSDSIIAVGTKAAGAAKGITSLMHSKSPAPAATAPSANAQQPAASTNPAPSAAATSAGTPTAGKPTAGKPTAGTPSAATSSAAMPDPSSVSGSTTDDAGAKFKMRTDEVAAEFSKMKPAQASQIISNMSSKEAVFAMLGMNTQQRSDILANMDPKQAADLSNLLAKFPPSKSYDPAAEQQLQNLPEVQKQMDDLVKTYSQLPANSAALLITELMKTNSAQAVNVMAQMDNVTRAQILSAMSNTKTNPDGLKYATAITERLLSLK